ncbi:hypothetical protein [Bernardetia sp.]|uniref:hypothetical protein n=1 Tax=Bernardetia sp. TaxID=1937974 RepID=UPI0025BF0D75|nr:hypothetical protein [Bernardetia sp.]
MRIFKLDFVFKHRFWLAFSLLLLSQVLYWFWIRNYTLAYFDENQKDTISWFSNLVESIYPRLKVEKYRFDAAFFIKKSDQIAIRFFFIGCIFSLLLLPKVYQKVKLFVKEKTVYTQKITVRKQYILITYFLVSNVLLSQEWLEILTEYSQIADLYEPISFYKIVAPSFPTLPFLTILFYGLRIISIIGVVFFLFSIFSKDKFLIQKTAFVCLLLSAMLFIYLQGFLYGFGKTEHTYATWNWVCMLLPIWFWKTNFNTSNLNFVSQNYLVFISIGLVYASSGLEKIFIGGLEWLNGNALMGYLELSTTDLGQSLSNYPTLVFLLSIVTIFWEIGFLCIVHKSRKIRLTLIFIGVCFHVGVYFSMGVGHYLSPWMWVYVFLL